MEAQYEIELALMAGRAYQSTRMDINWLPVPDGWTEMQHKEGDSGFEAVSFFNGPDVVHSTEIVISYAGTNPNSLLDPDNAANIGLATGFGSEQLLQAAEYYLQVKALNPEVHITLTGHSLGGGLAALVGVFFGVQATTFDQAPFANSAEQNLLTPDVAANLKNDLLLKGYSETDLVGLTNFLQLREANGGIPNSELVSNIRVDGEFLSSAPLSAFDTIGTTTTVLTHGPYSDPSIDMHSMSLLTAFLQSAQVVVNSDNPQQTLSEATKKLTKLLEMFFDNELYSFDTDKGDENFLERLVKHQEGLDPTVPNDGDAMVGRFTTDMWKIAQDGGLTMDSNISKMLTAFAMQKYYEEPASGDDHGQTLFSDVTGGIRFNRAYVADTLDTAQGYKYFLDYVGSLSFGSNRDVLIEQAPNILDWYIQAGGQAMEATAGDERAFMLGGRGNDILTGGSQADLLVGNSGTDILSGGGGDDVLMVGWWSNGMLDSIGDILHGGAGNDILYGGNGADYLYGDADADLMIGGGGIDTYYIEGGDTIVDSGSNFIVYNGQILAGGFVQVEGTTNVYRSINNDQFTLTFNSPGHMVLNGTDSVTFENQTSAADFENGNFGIRLYDSVETSYVLTGTEDDDYPFFAIDGGAAHYVFSGSISGPGVHGFLGDSDWPSFGYSALATPPSLQIDGAGGNDYLMGLAGSDRIDGGSGNDRIIGDGYVNDSDPRYNPWGHTGAADILQGGVGNDWNRRMAA